MMKVVRDELKMEDVTFKQAFEMIKNDEKQSFNSEEEIMEYYSNIIRLVVVQCTLMRFV